MSDGIERVFDSRWLAVDHFVGNGSGHLRIPFSNWMPGGTNNQGPWLRTMVRLGLPCLFVIAKANHWFNTPDIGDCMAAARAVRDRYDQALLLGPSMGGHAAIRQSASLNASAVVALSPQYSIEPGGKAAFETRFRSEAFLIDRYQPDISPERTSGAVYIVFDDEIELDKKHVELIGREIACIPLPLSHSGHSSAKALTDLSLLPSIFNFSADAAANARLIAHINATYIAQGPRSATVIYQHALAMPRKEQRAYLSSITEVVGYKDHKAGLKRLMIGQLGSVPEAAAKSLA